ncbi:MAG: hypothetical protein KGL65_02420 [Rhodospirillales bacterium]|nr:hypothetical protein [Rhodospirillales bacterium]
MNNKAVFCRDLENRLQFRSVIAINNINPHVQVNGKPDVPGTSPAARKKSCAIFPN